MDVFSVILLVILGGTFETNPLLYIFVMLCHILFKIQYFPTHFICELNNPKGDTAAGCFRDVYYNNFSFIPLRSTF